MPVRARTPNGTPNNGFVGSPFEEHSNVYSVIYPAPLTNCARQYDSNVQNVSGSSVDSLLNHVHVSDPISGSYRLSRSTFENIYNARKYAVVVK